MKFTKTIFLALVTLMTVQAYAQNVSTTGELKTTTVRTFNYDKDGTSMPYKVTIREQRLYKSKFEQNEENKENWSRMNMPAKVAKLITVRSAVDNTINRVFALRYEKQLADTFEVVSTDRGFAVKVDGRTLEYILGEGIYFANTADKDFFVVDEFDVIQ